MGDGIQAAKAGILEIGDVFVVNKADRDGADRAVRDLRHAVDLGDRSEPGSWRAPVVRAVATTGDGVDDVVAAIEEHRAWLGRRGRRGDGADPLRPEGASADRQRRDHRAGA
jgi:LAO/AO transport system kinase